MEKAQLNEIESLSEFRSFFYYYHYDLFVFRFIAGQYLLSICPTFLATLFLPVILRNHFAHVYPSTVTHLHRYVNVWFAYDQMMVREVWDFVCQPDVTDYLIQFKQ